MDNELLDHLWRGLELRNPFYPVPRPVDFLALGESRTLVVFADWWTMDRDSERYAILSGHPEPVEPGMWAFPEEEQPAEKMLLGPASDETYDKWMRSARTRMRLSRGPYLAELELLRDGFPEEDGTPEFDFLPWVSHVLEHPALNPMEEYQKRAERLREVGRLVLVDGDENIVGVLVLDEDDGYEVVGDPTGWLASMAEQRLTTSQPRPSLSDFFHWLEEQAPPYGVYRVAETWVGMAEGPLDRIAFQRPDNTLGA